MDRDINKNINREIWAVNRDDMVGGRDIKVEVEVDSEDWVVNIMEGVVLGLEVNIKDIKNVKVEVEVDSKDQILNIIEMIMIGSEVNIKDIKDIKIKIEIDSESQIINIAEIGSDNGFGGQCQGHQGDGGGFGGQQGHQRRRWWKVYEYV
ncbi:hypothetical protein SBOR_6814 [Sclerotinia borealis F-4128]|uniref:Uncharacterized protein n=1 Tax=Sclerotinia borealis (strain F-4128) TaxID=1432307 RepID=W9CAJ5_SCLBF|nr:hypothetical protein SBOR_6814 [Sclerotinia borealis F-4128]